MTRNPEVLVQAEQVKAYAKPTLDKRAKLTDVAEGIPIVVSGIVIST